MAAICMGFDPNDELDRMFRPAETVAYSSLPLTEIPLMESIAIQTLGAYFSRREDEGL